VISQALSMVSFKAFFTWYTVRCSSVIVDGSPSYNEAHKTTKIEDAMVVMIALEGEHQSIKVFMSI